MLRERDAARAAAGAATAAVLAAERKKMTRRNESENESDNRDDEKDREDEYDDEEEEEDDEDDDRRARQREDSASDEESGVRRTGNQSRVRASVSPDSETGKGGYTSRWNHDRADSEQDRHKSSRSGGPRFGTSLSTWSYERSKMNKADVDVDLEDPNHDGVPLADDSMEHSFSTTLETDGQRRPSLGQPLTFTPPPPPPPPPGLNRPLSYGSRSGPLVESRGGKRPHDYSRTGQRFDRLEGRGSTAERKRE